MAHIAAVLLEHARAPVSREDFVRAALDAASRRDPRRYPPGERGTRYERSLLDAWEHGVTDALLETTDAAGDGYVLTQHGRELSAEPPSQPSRRKPLRRIVGIVAALLLGAAGAIFNDEVGDAWSSVRGKDRARLELLSVQVEGEPACNPHNNAPALGRIVGTSEFPRATFLLKNEGAEDATLTRVELTVERVWTLRDPHGEVQPRGEFEPETPAFGAYGGHDVRIDTEGFVIPPTIAIAQDVEPGQSAGVKVVFRRIDDPTLLPLEHVFLIGVDFVHDDGRVEEKLLVSSQAIGTYWPVYEDELLIDDGSTFDRKVDEANLRTLRQVAAVEARVGGRVQRLIAERGLPAPSQPQAAESC